MMNGTVAALPVLYQCNSEIWRKATIGMKGPLMCITDAGVKGGAVLAVEVIEGYHLIKGGQVATAEGKTRHMLELHHSDAHKTDYFLATESVEELRAVEDLLEKALENTAQSRQHIEARRTSSKKIVKEVKLSGWMNKSNKLRKVWKDVDAADLRNTKFQRRYFVIVRDHLNYYERSEHLTALGTVDLVGHKVIKEETITGREYTFVLQTASRECMVLQCEGFEELDEWLSALKRIRKQQKQSKEDLFAEVDMKAVEKSVAGMDLSNVRSRSMYGALGKKSLSRDAGSNLALSKQKNKSFQ